MPCILILTDTMAAGGMERQIVELLKGLKRNGRYRIAFGVLGQGGGRELEAKALVASFLNVKRKFRYDVSPAFALIQQAKEANCRLIHTFGWMSGLAGLFAARRLEIPIINGSIREAYVKLGVRQWISRWCALQSDVIVSNSKSGLCSYKLSAHPRARVIHNGIDFDRFAPVIAEKNREKTICMVANFSQYKDQRVVIQAMPLVHKVYPKAQLVLVGRDAGTLSKNLDLAERLNLTHSIRFITDSIHPEPIIAGSDVCVLATHREGISNAILEYMALGKPVIATNIPANLEIIQDGKTGLIVQANSPAAISEKIIELFSSPDRADRIANAGCRWVKENFYLDKMILDYEALYEQLLSSRKS